MSLNLDVVIDTGEEYSVDMKAGLDTLQGVSDGIRKISTTILEGRRVQKNTYKSKVRTNLQKTFKGSYGHTFTLDIYDEELQKKFNKIGRVVFTQLIEYFFCESLSLKPLDNLLPKTLKIIEDLGEKADSLIDDLRRSSLIQSHRASTKFGHEVKVRFRKNRHEQRVLVRFNKNTSKIVDAVLSDETIDIEGAVTRFNIRTGNGRIVLNGEEKSISFGFSIQYKQVRAEAKQIFSENLHYNNNEENNDYRYLKLKVTPLYKNDNVIKYFVKGFYRDE